ncbi:hypothetical protein Pint_08322 [Pistacia integerrima]|uniref:Uncharacterized protein n=1 Tax=Pistacia integerrima TaxID=434235 RepID=A0ACC0XU04_9ROSI|nr:hypothetical protein Pint_08322 [Pistacia integerrima]
MDGFDQLPDSLILLIFNSVSDIKSLIRCRAVSKRFNSIVPQTESLSLTVDRVISPESESDSLLVTFLKIFFKSLHDLLSTSIKPHDPTRTLVQNSPAQILTKFDRVRNLRIELPAGDLTLDKGVSVKWRAEFGRSLKSCVIIGFKSASTTASENPVEGGLKTRVMWTISALIVASAKHFMLEDVVRQHEEMESLVLIDREGEGTVVMDKEGMRECRLGGAHVSEGQWDRSRTMVPSVKMRMRHEPKLMLKGGVWVEGATLVVVRPSEGKDDVDDGELALGAFGDGIYREAVQELLKSRSYMLEMNSF